MHFTLTSAAMASAFLSYVFISSELMGTRRDVTRWEAPCQRDWFIPSICSAAVPADPVRAAPRASTPPQTDPTSWKSSVCLRGRGRGAAGVQRLYEQRTKSFHRYLANVIGLRSNLITFGPHVLECRICIILTSSDHKSVNGFHMHPRVKWMFSNSQIAFSAQIELRWGPPLHSTTKQFHQTTR